MSEAENQGSQTQGSLTQPVQDDDGKPAIWVSFCPDLGIYHIHREVDDEDTTDSKFTRDDLVDIVEGMISSAQVTEATQLTTLCAWGRLFAHKIVVFYTSGMFRVFNPVQPDVFEKDESGEMREFFDAWKKAHPTEESIPTVVAYARPVKKA